MGTKKVSVDKREDFAKFYLISWGIIIQTENEAARFVSAARKQMKLSNKQILLYLESLYDEGITMSDEYYLVRSVMENERG